MPSPTVSDRKIHANRANALKSTGPQTPEGKARSSMNALKHGICSIQICIEGEDPLEYHHFRIEMIRFTSPRNIVELQFAEQFIGASWKLKRLQSAELDLYDDRVDTLRQRHPGRPIAPGFTMASLLWEGKEFGKLHRYERQLTNIMHRAMEQLRKRGRIRCPASSTTLPPR